MLHQSVLTVGLILLAASALSAQGQQPDTGRIVDGQLVSDTFKIETEWQADTLLVSIRSDLPDNTTVMVSIDRYYWEVGSSSTYPIPYHSTRSDVGTWEDQTHQIEVDDQFWRDSLKAHQRQMAGVGMPFKVREIGDSIHVDFTVPAVQDDPRFGKGNSNLVGEAVDTAGARVVNREVGLYKPIGDPPAPSPWVSRTELQPGQTYVLTDGAPLMPALEPEDPIAASAAARQIPPDGEITVEEVRTKDGTPWYRVEAVGASGQRLGEGWINSTALIGQDIRRADH